MPKIEAINWSEMRSANIPSNIPNALKILSESDDEQALEKAYWAIDNEAVLQGMLFQTALPVTTYLLNTLNTCTKMARPYLMELLVQLISGYPAPIEVKMGNQDIQKNIRDEVLMRFSTFIDIADNGTNKEKELCIDILGVLVIHNQGLKQEVIKKMEQISTELNDDDINELVNNWCDEIT